MPCPATAALAACSWLSNDRRASTSSRSSAAARFSAARAADPSLGMACVRLTRSAAAVVGALAEAGWLSPLAATPSTKVTCGNVGWGSRVCFASSWCKNVGA
jgi:hypothetical protein